MSYAIRKDGLGWRAVGSPADVGQDEDFSLSEPVLDSPAQQVASCTPWQFRKALNATGLRAAVDAHIASADLDTKDGYAVATEFRSDDPMFLAAAAAVGKTPDEAYEFIAFAKSL